MKYGNGLPATSGLLHKRRIEGTGRRLAAFGVKLLNQLGHQPGPAGLMAGAEPRAVVAVEIFKEENRAAPVFVALKFFYRAVCGPAPGLVGQEEFDQPPRQLLADVPEVHHLSRPGRAFDLEVVAVAIVREVRVILLQRFDDQEVDREPHGPAPIRVAAEQPGLRLRRLVIYTVLDALDVDSVRVVPMEAR